MKKFYPKKDLPAEASPVMLQLQRRHTVMEADNDGTSAKKLKQISRSNSASSVCKTPNTSTENRLAEGMASPDSASSSAASTVVITESELASSWLYNNKKAQMGSSEVINKCESTSQQLSDKEEMKSPILPRPKVKSTSYSSKRSKCATCCCYLSVILIVSLSAMGILSAVGGIVYMELFTTLNKTQSLPIESTIVESEVSNHNDLYSMDKMRHSTEFGLNQKSSDVLKIENRKSERGIVKVSSKLDKSLDGEFLQNTSIKNETNEITTSLDEKESPSVEESTIAEIINSKSIEEDIAQIIYNISENFNPMKNFLRNKDGSSPYSKLFELYKGIHSSSESSESSSDSADQEIIEPSFESIKLSTISPILFPNDSHLILGSEHEENEKREPELESDINSILTVDEEQDLFKKEVIGNNVEVDSTTLAEEHDQLEIESNESDIEVKEDKEVKDNPIPMYFFKMPTELIDRNDSGKAFSNKKNSKNIEVEGEAENLEIADTPMGRFLPHIPDFFNENQNSDEGGNLIEQNNVTNGKNSDVSIDLNRPIAGVAIPKPFNMFNRPSREDKIESLSEIEKQDRQFSLAEALERLRMLDIRDIIPTARSASQNKNSVQKKMIGPKKQTDEEIASERSGYLQTLRGKLFDSE